MDTIMHWWSLWYDKSNMVLIVICTSWIYMVVQQTTFLFLLGKEISKRFRQP